MQLEDALVLCSRPLDFLDVGVQVIVPSTAIQERRK